MAKSKRKKANGDAAVRKKPGMWSDLKPGPANFNALSPISFLPRAAEIWPDRVAVVHGGTKFTYAQLYERAKRLASSLKNAGARD